MFLPGVERLAQAGHRVILADLPGSGRSEPVDWTFDGPRRGRPTARGDARLRDWTLYGHSFGGYVAAQHLVSFPDATRG